MASATVLAKTQSHNLVADGLSKTVLRDLVVKRLDEAGRALEVAVTIPQHKLVADVAAAQEIFAARQSLSDDVIGYAHALKIEALAGLGELLKKAPKAKGTDRGGRPKIDGSRKVPSITPPTLAEQGVNKKTANLARKLAALSDTERNAVAARDKTLAAVTREKTAKVRAQRLVLPDAKYRVLYVDPPWKYRDTADAGGVQGKGAEHHYPTMSIDDLCALDIKSLGDRDSVLWMWVTSPLLFECAPVIDAWGYTYKASVIWDKAKHNQGHYVSVQHEFLLICTRGSATPDTAKRRRSIIEIKPGRHSEKPEAFRELIDMMYTQGKRIELFARTMPPAPWERWGNEH